MHVGYDIIMTTCFHQHYELFVNYKVLRIYIIYIYVLRSIGLIYTKYIYMRASVAKGMSRTRYNTSEKKKYMLVDIAACTHASIQR